MHYEESIFIIRFVFYKFNSVIRCELYVDKYNLNVKIKETNMYNLISNIN